MSGFQGVFAAFGILAIMGVMSLAVVLVARFVIHRAELLSAIGHERNAELYPLTHKTGFEVLGLIFCLAFFLEETLRRHGVPFVYFLSRAAIVYWVLSALYSVGRSIYLLRKLPASDVSARRFVRMTFIESSVAAVLISLAFILLYFRT